MTLVQASQPDELTIDEQEMLEVIEDGDMEDWVKVHKSTSHTICVFFFLSCDVSMFINMSIFASVRALHCYYVFSRPAIRLAMLATSQKNTCSSRPPTVC